ncbi:MAG: hypothetical protein WB503_11890, partial [Pseudolabrys sp.]
VEGRARDAERLCGGPLLRQPLSECSVGCMRWGRKDCNYQGCDQADANYHLVSTLPLIPAKAGIQLFYPEELDARLRRHER